MLKSLFIPKNITQLELMDAINSCVARSQAIISSITINLEDDQRSMPSNETILYLVDAIGGHLDQIEMLSNNYWNESNKIQ